MFTNKKTGDEVEMLRFEKGEQLQDAIKRLSAMGWIIPNPGKLIIGEDNNGKLIKSREKSQTKEPKSESEEEPGE
jgi:hypothetical protein